MLNAFKCAELNVFYAVVQQQKDDNISKFEIYVQPAKCEKYEQNSFYNVESIFSLFSKHKKKETVKDLEGERERVLVFNIKHDLTHKLSLRSKKLNT